MRSATPRLAHPVDIRPLFHQGAPDVRALHSGGLCIVALFCWATVSALVAGCRSDGGCKDGICGCPAGASCDLGCSAPPCHATCEGSNPACTAVCANGTCTCGADSHCDFTCDAPPCHVTCEMNTSCSGTCANGQCTCGPQSNCAFTCSAPPCHTTCASGSTCIVACPSGGAGTEACDIVACAAGAPTICPNGKATTCGAACP